MYKELLPMMKFLEATHIFLLIVEHLKIKAEEEKEYCTLCGALISKITGQSGIHYDWSRYPQCCPMKIKLVSLQHFNCNVSAVVIEKRRFL